MKIYIVPMLKRNLDVKLLYGSDMELRLQDKEQGIAGMLYAFTSKRKARKMFGEGVELIEARTIGKNETIRKGAEMNKTIECECKTWCDINLTHRLLTGHHENCPNSPSALSKALELIKDLTEGMDAWAGDEDGIHPKAWKSYCKAKSLQGMINKY